MPRLDSGCRGFAYSSGMAAITSLLLLFRSGDHLIVTEDLYGGTCRLFDQIFNQYGLTFTYVDTSDPEAVKAAITPATKALFVETLTNPLLKFADLEQLSAICRGNNLLLIADNTFLTPYLLKPAGTGGGYHRLQRYKISFRSQRRRSRPGCGKRPTIGGQNIFPPELGRSGSRSPRLLAGHARHENPGGTP